MSKELYDLLRDWFKEVGDVHDLVQIDDIVYPTTELTIQIHDFLIDHFPSNDKIHSGVLQEGNIDHALYVMKFSSIKGSKRQRVITKAAKFMDYMFGGHAFVDGNKRTGFVMALFFITINLDEDVVVLDYLENVKFFEKIASREISPENVAELKQFLIKGLTPINA